MSYEPVTFANCPDCGQQFYGCDAGEQYHQHMEREHRPRAAGPTLDLVPAPQGGFYARIWYPEQPTLDDVLTRMEQLHRARFGY